MKYPKTNYLPFSPSKGSKDDYIIRYENMYSLVGHSVVVTEKLDGTNTCLKEGKVWARSHEMPATHDSFDRVKNMMAELNMNRNMSQIYVYGETMTAVHSIEYQRLDDFFYVFAIFDIVDNYWMPWDDVKKRCRMLCLKTVPELFVGSFGTFNGMEKWMNEEIKKDSTFYGPREGFVVRQTQELRGVDNSFSSLAGKYVRENHVQSVQHWSTDWKPAAIKV